MSNTKSKYIQDVRDRLVTCVLLLFEQDGVFGFTLPKVQQLKSSDDVAVAGTNKTVVYKVKEGDTETVSLIYPQAKKPTLREIIYYHVIETPYTNNFKKVLAEGPDFDDTRRPFTNSHGLPILSDESTKNDSSESSSGTDGDTIEEGTITDSGEDSSDGDSDPGDSNESSNNTDEDVTEKETNSDGGEDSDHNQDEDSNDGSNKTEEDVTNEDAITNDEKDTGEDDPKLDERDNFGTEKADKTSGDKSGVSPDGKEPKDYVSGVYSNQTATEGVTQDVTPSGVATEVEVPQTDAPAKRVDDVLEEKKNARNSLFNQIKDKYENARKPENSSSRRKREIDIWDIPQAPRLPKINLNDLPERIRKLMSTPEPEPAKFHDHNETPEFNEDTFKEELQNKIQEMLAHVKPKDDNTPYDQDADNGNGRRVVRTYGMNLKEDRGRVWNNLWTNPGISFDVGSLESVENVENNKEEYKENETYKAVAHPTESKPITHEDKDHSTELINVTDDNKSNADNNNSKEFVINIPDHNDESNENDNKNSKEFVINVTESNKANEDNRNNSEEFISNVTENNQRNGENDDKSDEEIIKEERGEEIDKENYKSNEGGDVQDLSDIFVKMLNKTKALNDNIDEIAGKKNPKEKEREKPVADKQKKSEEETVERHSDVASKMKDTPKSEDKDENSDIIIAKKRDMEQSDFFKELMRNEQFWKWLGDWTATYMELLMKHVKRLVHDEVGRQMKKFALNIQKQQDEVQAKAPENGTKDNVGKDKDIKNVSEDNEDISKISHKIKPNANESKIEEGTKDIPLTHNTNYTGGEETNLKHRKNNGSNKETSQDVKDKQISIRAKNIFGNSAGTDKVTNIFIFYPTKDAFDLKPEIQDSNNTFEIGTNTSGEIEIDKRVQKNSTEKKPHTEPNENIDVNINKQRDEEDHKDSNNTLDNSNKETDIINEEIDKENKKDSESYKQKNEIAVEDKTPESTTKKPEDEEKKSEEDSKVIESLNKHNDSNLDSKPSPGKVDKDEKEVTSSESNNNETTKSPKEKSEEKIEPKQIESKKDEIVKDSTEKSKETEVKDKEIKTDTKDKSDDIKKTESEKEKDGVESDKARTET